MAAALRAARWMAGAGRCIAVLGYMAELGPIAEEEHERIGALVARLGIDVLIVVGSEARPIGLAARREGVPSEETFNKPKASIAARSAAGQRRMLQAYAAADPRPHEPQQVVGEAAADEDEHQRHEHQRHQREGRGDVE